MSVEIYGTLGPACADAATLAQMIDAGMTGIRLNLSHMTLREAQPYLDAVRAAERESGRSIGLLLDMQGPELRVGRIRTAGLSLRRRTLYPAELRAHIMKFR